jgi:hypothetical protein
LKKNQVRLIIFTLLFVAADYGVSSLLLNGLHKYFGLNQDTKVALIGHSHLMLGIDKNKFEKEIGQPITKYTSEGVNVADRQLMINYLLKSNPETQVVIYGVDAWMFTGEGLSENSYKLFLPFIDDSKVGKDIKVKASMEEYWQKKLIRTTRYSEALINSAIRGQLSNWSNYKFGTVDTTLLKRNVVNGSYRKINSDKTNRKNFEETLELLSNRNIKVILVYVPTISFYNEAQPNKFLAERNYFKRISLEYKNCFYLEYIENWENKYSYFFDPIHLNPKGQAAFTKTFSKDILKIIR